jgi:hypothetical protein
MERIKAINGQTGDLLQDAIIQTLPIQSEDNRNALLRSSCVSIFTNHLAKTRFDSSTAEVKRAWRFAQTV